jgi:Transglutaminase-like superfamily
MGIRSFLAWPFAEKWLLFKAWILVAGVRTALWTLRFKRTRQGLDRFNRAPPGRLARERPAAVRVAHLVEIASRFVPGGGHCLTRALAAESLLARRGYDVHVTIGVAKDDDDRLIAHAWVRCDGSVLIGGDPELERYTELNPPN